MALLWPTTQSLPQFTARSPLNNGAVSQKVPVFGKEPELCMGSRSLGLQARRTYSDLLFYPPVQEICMDKPCAGRFFNPLCCHSWGNCMETASCACWKQESQEQLSVCTQVHSRFMYPKGASRLRNSVCFCTGNAGQYLRGICSSRDFSN